jgi:hypothetical protein
MLLSTVAASPTHCIDEPRLNVCLEVCNMSPETCSRAAGCADDRVRLLADRRVPAGPRRDIARVHSARRRSSLLAVIETSSVSCYPVSPSVLCSALLMYHPKVQDSIFSTCPFRLHIIENLTYDDNFYFKICIRYRSKIKITLC